MSKKKQPIHDRVKVLESNQEKIFNHLRELSSEINFLSNKITNLGAKLEDKMMLKIKELSANNKRRGLWPDL